MNLSFIHNMRTMCFCLLVTLVLANVHPVAAATLTTENIIGGRQQTANAIGVVFGPITNKQIGQSITTSVGGSLDNIAVDINTEAGTSDDLTLSIFTAVGDIPGTLLGSITEPQSSFPSGSGSPTTIDFSGLGIILSPNTKYVIAASVTIPISTGQYLWETSLDSGYAGGIAIYNNGGASDEWQPLPAHQDLGFGVYVNPIPIPTALWLFGSGLLGLVGIARRKKA